jgi:hypothetical protein
MQRDRGEAIGAGGRQQDSACGPVAGIADALRVLRRLAGTMAMGVAYLVAIVPLALVLRALGRDPLRLRRDRAAASYWIARAPPGPTPDSMTDQF